VPTHKSYQSPGVSSARDVLYTPHATLQEHTPQSVCFGAQSSTQAKRTVTDTRKDTRGRLPPLASVHVLILCGTGLQGNTVQQERVQTSTWNIPTTGFLQRHCLLYDVAHPSRQSLPYARTAVLEASPLVKQPPRSMHCPRLQYLKWPQGSAQAWPKQIIARPQHTVSVVTSNKTEHTANTWEG
jgi:hypothetical protein